MAKLTKLYFSLESDFFDEVIHHIPPQEALKLVVDENDALRLPNGKLVANEGNYVISEKGSEGTKSTETYFGGITIVTLPNDEKRKYLEVSFETLYNYCKGNRDYVPTAYEMYEYLDSLIKAA